MYYHRLIISYKGTNYFGWQDLGNNNDKPTVQKSIQTVLDKICKYQNSIISSASRTDAGVHAQGQVLKVSIPLEIESSKLQLGMNSLLPPDIRILECKASTIEFNPNKDSVSKEYHYCFCTDKVYNPILNDIVTHISSNNGILDIKLMKEACNLFIGEHDFYCFAKRDTNMKSTIRTVLSCEILELQASAFSNKIYYLKIVGNGFLSHMVRYIMGALFELGNKKLSLKDISEALKNHKEEKISVKAKSKGLQLIGISY